MNMKLYPPIVVNSEEVWDRINECEKLAAKDPNLMKTWEHVWEILSNLSNQEGENVKLFLDFAPYSFLFHARGLQGGLIFHGAHDSYGDGGAPTFSVNLSKSYGWSLHT